MARLRFLPQDLLDGWTDQGKVDLKADRLVDLATGDEFPMREALRFTRVESGEDTNALLRKVKPLQEVKDLGGEHYATSVIVGETVYEVVPGWVAEEPEPPPEAAAVAGKPASKKFDAGGNQDADALAKLLLDKLS